METFQARSWRVRSWHFCERLARRAPAKHDSQWRAPVSPRCSCASGYFKYAAGDKLWFANELFLPPFQGLEIFWTVDQGRRSLTRFALGYYLSGFQLLSLERQVEFFFTKLAEP